MVVYSPEVQTLLNSLYAEPGRHYHNINHIKYMLAMAHRWNIDTNADNYMYEMLQHAIWWHDAVYNIYNPPTVNEIQSAELFHRMVDMSKINISENDCNYIVNAIEATAHHLVTEKRDRSTPTTLKYLLLDIDLSGFAEDIAVVRANSELVIKEYAPLQKSDIELASGRLRFLKELLRRDVLFYTDYFFKMCEDKARKNILTLINDLEGFVQPPSTLPKPHPNAVRMVNKMSYKTGWVYRQGTKWILIYDDGSIWYTKNIDFIALV